MAALILLVVRGIGSVPAARVGRMLKGTDTLPETGSASFSLVVRVIAGDPTGRWDASSPSVRGNRGSATLSPPIKLHPVG